MAAPRSTQDFVPIDQIRDGVLVLKNGSLIKILLTSSLNFALKSMDEREAIILQYQNFLNSLDFTVQIVIQSRKLDIRPYLNSLENNLKDQTNELIKIQTKEYIGFIKNFTEGVNVMSKSFFVVIPYNPPVFKSAEDMFSKLLMVFKKEQNHIAAQKVLATFEESKGQLEQRVNVATQGLSRLGVRVAPLGTEELIELFYKVFNPGELGKINR